MLTPGNVPAVCSAQDYLQRALLRRGCPCIHADFKMYAT